jgi:hypothetical protein
MRYICLIYEQESQWAKMSDSEKEAIYRDYYKFQDDIKKSGHYVAGEPLEPTHTATTVRVRNGKAQTTDGPFAETKEQLGGYYLIDAKDLDEAVAIAGRIPGARFGSIEVRPVMVVPATLDAWRQQVEAGRA